MHEGAHVLKEWSDYYVIAGSSAAALTGLMFVVITLVAGDRTRVAEVGSVGVSTFSTPTVVHFGAALFLSLVLSAPWRSLAHLSAVLAVTGACGLAYAALLTHRMRYRLHHEVYSPQLDDWLWYAILPLVAYASTLAAALWLGAGAAEALVAVAAATALLIFIGIHNAWDVVTYLTIGNAPEPTGGGSGDPSAPEPTAAVRATATTEQAAPNGEGPPKA